MKITQFICLVLGSASATVEVAIDNTKIEHTAHALVSEYESIAQTSQSLNYTRAMHQAQMEAGFEIRQSQKAIMKPAIKDLQSYVQYFSPNKACNVNGLATCLNQFAQTGQPIALGMQECSSQNTCTVRWENLSIQKKMKLEQKFGRNSQQMQMAFGELEQHVLQTYQTAAEAQAQNIQYLAHRYNNATKNMLKNWGCNGSCVDSFTAAQIHDAIAQCSCPTGIKFNETNEPFANVTLDQIMDQDNIEMTTNSTNANVGIQNGKLSANVNVNGLTTTVVLIFAFQLIFCFSICCYTNHQVQQAQNREEKQKAEFYSFLFNFHKQMADEEQAMQDLYKNPDGGTSAGAPKKL